MKQNEYTNSMREIVFYFLAAPATILIGMAVVGTILDSFLKTNDTFSKLFVFIGGIPGIGTYYYKKWKEFNKSNITVKTNEDIDRSLKKLDETLEKINQKIN